MTNAISSIRPAAKAAPHDLIEVTLPEGFWSYYRDILGTSYPIIEVQNDDGSFTVTVNGIDAGFILTEAVASANGYEGAPESLDAYLALEAAGVGDDHLFMMMDEVVRRRSLLPEG
jgi:hypothetical protein